MLASKSLLFLIIPLLLISGCNYSLIKNKEDNAPKLNVFAKVKVLTLIEEINESGVLIEAKEIKDYTSLGSNERLLEKGDKIMVHFTGIGNKDSWKTNSLTSNDLISIEIRCLDGRINSNNPFTEDDCYWEGEESSIVVER